MAALDLLSSGVSRNDAFSLYALAASKTVPVSLTIASPFALSGLLFGKRITSFAKTSFSIQSLAGSLLFIASIAFIAAVVAYVVRYFSQRAETTVLLASIVGVVAAGAFLFVGRAFFQKQAFAVAESLAAWLPPECRTSRFLFVAAILMAFLCVSALRLVLPEYISELRWAVPLTLVASTVAAAGGLFFSERVGWGLTGLVVAAVFVAAQLISPASHGIERALATNGVVAYRLSRSIKPLGSSVRATATGASSCRPGEKVTALDRLGKVGRRAPDILLITVDGWRFDHSSFDQRKTSRSTKGYSPRLAERATSAAVFTRAYTQAPNTRHAFRSLFTGLLPGQIDAPNVPKLPWAASLPPEQPTIAGYLRNVGYETIALVSNPKAFPADYHILNGFGEIDQSLASFHKKRRYSASVKMSKLIGRLAQPPQHARKPRFVWTHLMEPHRPFGIGPEIKHPSGLKPQKRYEWSIRYIDQQLDRLIEFALGSERKNETWVIITSDHGEAWGEHKNRRHGSTVYEEEIHVPLLVWGPGVRAGRIDMPVSLVDLLPTILSAAGLSSPAGVCGQSLMPTLRTGKTGVEVPVLSAALPDGTRDYLEVAFIAGEKKLIVHGDTGEVEAFDLKEDSQEKKPQVPSAEELDALRKFLGERGMPANKYGLKN